MPDPISRIEAAIEESREQTRAAHEVLKDLTKKEKDLRALLLEIEQVLSARASVRVDHAFDEALHEAVAKMPEMSREALEKFVEDQASWVQQRMFDSAADRVVKDMHDIMIEAAKERLDEVDAQIQGAVEDRFHRLEERVSEAATILGDPDIRVQIERATRERRRRD